MAELESIRVGLDPSLAASSAEVKYVFRTLLRLAGYPYEFMWVGDVNRGIKLDIYYGPEREDIAAAVKIVACGKLFADAPTMEPNRFLEQGGVAFLDFVKGHGDGYHSGDGGLRFSNDIIFASYWLLSGAREPLYRRDRWDNLQLEGSFFIENSLNSKPLVSLYGSLLREYFRQPGRAPLDFPWTSPQIKAAFLLSHDVDYPQIIRSIECLRLLGTRGLKSFGSIKGVLRGTNHFWKFVEWVEFGKRIDARPAFFFMGRKGSLFQYALGTPDGFYDIRAKEFKELFRYLIDEGCEIGLHASYNSYRSKQQLQHEKALLEEAAGVRVDGNRHHYWHLDPESPNETLRKHEQAGLLYDSSLAFEFYPGFRRGICHPFRVFDAGERRELSVVELPPAWMDDHFDRRLGHNKIANPESYASHLVKVAQATNGVIVVDYHPRGMNSDFYPRYGPWLMKFIEDRLDSSISFQTPGKVFRQYVEYETLLSSHSRDLTESGAVRLTAATKAGHQADGPVADGPVKVELLKPGEEEQWESFVRTHPHGTIYHTLAWKAVTEEGLGHKAYYLRALDASGEFTGVLPLFLVRGIFGRRLVSLPMRDRGGVLARDSQTASFLISQAKELTRELDCKYLELRSLEAIDASVAGDQCLRCEQNWITTRIDLSPGVEQIWKTLDQKAVRWAINNADKKGVRIETETTREGMETFYQMFFRTRQSMGIPPFSIDLFLAIWRHLISQGSAQLFLAWKDSEPIGGMVNFLYKDTVIYAYGAPLREWKDYHPSDSLLWKSVKSAAQQGLRYFDFGADSPRQTGLLRFKKKWGGTHQPMFYYYFLNGLDAPPNFDSSGPAYSLSRKVWAKLPAPVSRRLGGWVTRQLS